MELIRLGSLKIGIIGAGSAVFSMRLVSDLVKLVNRENSKRIRGSKVVLMDVDEDRLKAVTILAEKFADEFDADITFDQTTDIDETITDSDFIINTALVGGHKFLESTREIGEKHGYYRGIDTQEFNMVSDYYTLTNWNQLAYFLEIAKKVGHNNKTNPWLLQAANPVFEGTTLIHRETDTNMVGFCHGHHGVGELIAPLNLTMEEVDWQVAGVNHGIWLNRLEKDGKVLCPQLVEYFRNREEWHPEDPTDDQLSPVVWDMYQFYGMFPVGDTQRNTTWRYHYSLSDKKKWYGEPWGGFDSEIGWNWYGKKLNTITANLQKIMNTVVSNPEKPSKEIFFKDIDQYPPEIAEEIRKLYNPEQLSGEQHIPFIDAISNNNRDRFVVNTINNSTIKGLDDDVACEFPAMVDEDGIHPEEINPPLTERILKWYLRPRVLRMEWALEAFLKKDKSLIKEILMRDRRTQSPEQAEAVVDELFNRSQ